MMLNGFLGDKYMNCVLILVTCMWLEFTVGVTGI